MTKPRNYRGTMITAVIALAVGVACYALARTNPWAIGGSGLPDTFTLDLKSFVEVDPALIHYEQSAEIPVAMENVRAIAVGPNNEIYVAGDQAVHVLKSEGAKHSIIEVKGTPTCLAVGAADHAKPGRIYIGVGRRIEIFSPAGEPVGAWDAFDENTSLTSIALSQNDIFAADAGNRLVHRIDPDGKLVAKIGEPDPQRQMPGFSVPSEYFDIMVDPDELLHVVNPGRLQIESFSFDGNLETFWGEASPKISGFFGCCNPSQIARLSDGKFVTSEKGIPRVKIYSDTGEFESVVAGPEQLNIKAYELGDPRSARGGIVFDVATDTDDRVLVLDPKKKCVRIFVPTENKEEAE